MFIRKFKARNIIPVPIYFVKLNYMSKYFYIIISFFYVLIINRYIPYTVYFYVMKLTYMKLFYLE